jgi:GNAT superfamily N-acetyltransferase
MIIRALEPEDVIDCINAGREMHEESVYASIPFSERSLLTLAQQCLDHPDYVCFVGYEGSELVGMMVGAKSKYWFSDSASYAADLALYVRKDFRGSTCAIRLLQAFMRWAKSSGCVDIRCGVTTKINPEVAKRLYVDAFGFEDGGSLYTKRISPLTA